MIYSTINILYSKYKEIIYRTCESEKDMFKKHMIKTDVSMNWISVNAVKL